MTVLDMLDSSQKMQQRMSFNEYIEGLERERSKVEVFKRELPLCLELLIQAIEACKQQLPGTTTEYNLYGQSECSEQTSTEDPILEEFIPIKKRAASDFHNVEGADDDEQHSPKSKISKETNHIDKKKSDWLSSAQLWNSDPPVEENATGKETATKVKENGGAFQPFQREKTVGKTNASTSYKASTSSVPMPSTSSTAERVKEGDHIGRSRNEDKEEKRKQRRSWSSELHNRFLDAVQQLGGSDVATPKQIRELMKVDRLTNDEVKSHLQKYRLHTRRPSPTDHINNANPQTPPFVLVGGIWVQPPEYAAMAAPATVTSGEVNRMSAAPNGIYTPLATHPPTLPYLHAALGLEPKPKQTEQSEQFSESEERASHREGGVRSNSPASSSSTH